MNRKDIAAGLIFVAIGAYFCIDAFWTLQIGTAVRMGPGYFPVMIGGLLVAFGLVIVLRGFGTAPSPFGAVSWRGIVLISLAPIVFGLAIRTAGLAPTVAMTSLVSAFASRRVGILRAAMLAIGLTIFCVLVFHYGLNLPITLIGPA
jgi:hypothetical protein